VSAVFGLIHFDGRPVAQDALDQVDAQLSGWGPDGHGQWRDGAAAFGHRLLAVTPASAHERMPIVDGDLAVTAAARLDNRDELSDQLGVSGSERPTTSDGRLVFLAFQRWGAECARHLFGDWSFAAWNARARTLVLARDQLGNTGLYYHHRPDLVAFSSAAWSLPGVERVLDDKRLAEFLAIRNDDLSRTFWVGTRGVLPGHTVTVTARRVEVVQYWRPDDAPALSARSDDDYVEGFLDRYRRAVRSRLSSRRPVATTLSAGLDSGSVTALAADLLREAEQRVVAFTSVPAHPVQQLFRHVDTDEWDGASAVAAHCGNVDHVAIRAGDASPLAVLDDALSIILEPQHGAGNLVWILPLLEECKRRRVGVLLTGQMGNGGVSWNGGTARTLFLLARGRFGSGLRALRERAVVSSWAAAIRRELIGAALGRLRVDRGPAFAATGFAMRHAAGKADGVWPMPPEIERRVVLFRNGVAAGPIWHALGSGFGLEVRDPTSDARLIEYCVGLPDNQHVRAGQSRTVLRRAMSGLMPDSARLRDRRGLQCADCSLRLAGRERDVAAALGRLERSEAARSYLDLDKLRQTWTSVRDNPSTAGAWLSAQMFLRAVMAGLFLERLARAESETRSPRQ
jgi:asparagine synthase (glutamine-hydrolysing)